MTEATSKPNVLVIDDDWVNRELMETILKRSGYQVKTVSRGEQGVQSVSEAPPQLVIVDFRLPDMSGVEVIRAIRALPLPHRVGIVVMSAMDPEKIGADVMEAGADLFISKVFAVPDLIARLKTLLTPPEP